MGGAQSRIAAIGRKGRGEGGGIGCHAARRRDQSSGDTIGDKAGAACRSGGDHRQAAGHRFERDIAESLGDRGVEEHIPAGERLSQRLAGLEAGEDAAGQVRLEPAARGAIADHQHLVGGTRFAQAGDGLGKDIEALFHHQPSEEDDGDVVVREAETAAPFGIAPRGGEDRAVHPPAPQPDAGVHPHRQQLVDHRLRGRDQRVAAVVEALEALDDQRLEEGHIVIARIGLEAGVDAGEHRQAPRTRPAQRGVGGRIGGGQVDDIGREGLQIALHRRAEVSRHAIFAPALHRHRHIGHADKIAGGREIGFVDLGRIDAHLRPARQQRADEAVQRLVGPVAGVVVVAAEQGNAKVGYVHGAAPLGETAADCEREVVSVSTGLSLCAGRCGKDSSPAAPFLH